MGYFDSVKEQRKTTISVVPAPAPDAVVSRRDGIHPYAQAIRTAWLRRLDDLPRPWLSGAAWDTNCFVTARKLIELANSPWSGYGLGDAHADYLDHAPSDGVWDKREKCWQQALGKAGAVALPEPDPRAPLPTVTTLDLDVEVADDGPPLNPIIDWHELYASAGEEQEWIVEPLLPARRMVALYSAPKAGKSLLMLEIAAGIAAGTEVIGAKPDRPRRVLYIDFENDPRGDVLTRLEAMDLTPEQLENLCYLTFPSLAKFDTQQGAMDLMRHVEGYGCEVVVIDTVSRAVMGEENENDTWLAFYRHTGLALKRAEVACIRLDHSGKDKDKGMRGGSAKSGDVDAVWRLTLLNENTIQLECTDHRMPIPVKSMTLVRQDYPLSHQPAGEAWQAASDAKVQAVDDRLESLRVPSSASVREAGKALREAGQSVENRALREAVRLRKLRLDLPTNVPVSPVPAAHSGTPRHTGPSVPRHTSPVGGVRHSPGTPNGTPPETDPDELVSCKTCFGPTTAGMAGTNGGLCATCSRTTEGNPS